MGPVKEALAAMDQTNSRRAQYARAVLWIGAFASIAYQTADDGDSVGIGPITVIRGLGPAVAFLLALLIAPSPVRKLRFGLAELGASAFLLIAVGSSTWSVDPGSTLLKSVPIVFVYLCCWRIAKMSLSFDHAVQQAIVAAQILVLMLLLELILAPAVTYSTDTAGSLPRLHLVVPGISSNVLGLVIALAVLGILFRRGLRILTVQPWSFFMLLACVACLVGTRSRVVTAVTVVIVLATIVVRAAKSRGWFVAGAFATASIATAIFVVVNNNTLARTIYEPVASFVLRGQDAGSLQSLTGRTVIWSYAMRAWREAPWTGYGYYAGHRTGLADLFPLLKAYSNLDSTWIESLVDVGVIGTIGLTVFAATAVLRLFRQKRSESRVIAVAFALAVMVMSFVNPTLQVPSSTLILLAVLVFGAGASTKSRLEPAVLRNSVFRSDNSVRQ